MPTGKETVGYKHNNVGPVRPVCRDYAIVYALGFNPTPNPVEGDTTDLKNLGEPIGPPFFTKVAELIGGPDKLLVQSLPYLHWENFPQRQSDYLAALALVIYKQCPKTKIILAGWGTGATGVHEAGAKLNPALLDGTDDTKILAAVTFGDPKKGEGFGAIPESKTLVFCHDDDPVCHGKNEITEAHGSYAQDADAAARFVVQQAKRAEHNAALQPLQPLATTAAPASSSCSWYQTKTLGFRCE